MSPRRSPLGAYAGFEITMPADGVALITFNRPDRLNGFTWAMKRDLAEAMVQLQQDIDSRVIVMTGSGKSFCAGDDFGRSRGDEHWVDARSPHIDKYRDDELGAYSSLRMVSQQMVRNIRQIDKLTIAAINGHCIQSGLSAALACDFRFAARDAKIGSATLRMGFLPDEGGHHLLVRILGSAARAKDFLYRKRIVDGDEALRLGLVSESLEPEDLLPRAMEFASELAEGPQVAMRMLKHAIDNCEDMTWEQAALDIAARTAVSDHHPDAREGARAFREKRKPLFNQALGNVGPSTPKP